MRSCVSTALAVVGVITMVSGCTSSPAPTDETNRTVTLVTHDSFATEGFEQAASAATGYNVKVVTAGDGGELSAQLVLTAGSPIADAFFGVDNVYASRLIENDVTEPFTPGDSVPERAVTLSRQLTSADTQQAQADALPMVAVDLGATCINIDAQWFAERNLAEPVTFEDLTRDEYRDLTVLLDPTSSSTGASFLIGTVAEFGDDRFAQYWSDLKDNGVRLEQSWTDAYNGQFTQGGGTGTFPIVLSYSSSPAWTLTDDGSRTTTKALLETCTTQVEYAGILRGASNPEGAKAVVDYLLSRQFQDSIAESMYMYPVDEQAYLPEQWQQYAPLPTEPRDLSPKRISAGMTGWLQQWSEATGW